MERLERMPDHDPWMFQSWRGVMFALLTEAPYIMRRVEIRRIVSGTKYPPVCAFAAIMC